MTMPSLLEGIYPSQGDLRVSTCIEIICFLDQKSVQTTIKQRFEQTGDRILASCVYEEFERILLVVQLSPTTDRREHTIFLQKALQLGHIEFYEYVACYPVSVFLDPSLDRDEHKRWFPLRVGESWYPALDHPHKVYLCLTRPFLAPAQVAWLNQNQARWEFENS